MCAGVKPLGVPDANGGERGGPKHVDVHSLHFLRRKPHNGMRAPFQRYFLLFFVGTCHPPRHSPHPPRAGDQIARALGMAYAFLPEFEELRSPLRTPETQGGGLHGNAVLSRFDLVDVRVIPHR